MADEHYERYRKVAHEQLYRELHAGSPQRLDALADNWHAVGETLRAMADDLRTELANLLASWVGDTSREYQERMGLVATWAEVLSGEAEAMRAGLSAMSSELANAQREAQPEPVDSSEWAHDVALASTLGLAVTEQQRGLSHDRLARVMAELSVAYELADHRAWSSPRVPAPLGLPGALLASDVPVGTQLAGEVAAPAAAAAPRLPVGGVPSVATVLDSAAVPVAGGAGPVRAATTLRGASSGLASSAGSAQLTTQRGAEAGGPAGTGAAPLPPPVMGAGIMPASTTEPVVTGRQNHDELSWSARDDAWGDDPDDRPPPVLGHSAELER